MQERGFETICHMGLLGIWTRQPCRRTLRTDIWNTDFFFHSRLLKMGQIGCLETSVRNHQYSLRNIPEGRSSLLLRAGSLKWRKTIALYIQYSEPPTDTKRDVTSNKLHIDNDSPSYEMNRKSACIQGHSDVTTRTIRWCRWRWRDIITASLETPPGG